MEVQIKVTRPAWLPAKLRWRTRIALTLVALLAVAVPVAWASHDFADVPTGHQFHNQISAIKGAGITQGCGGGNYCPDESVRRDAMAAFMHRGFGRVAYTPGTDVAASGTQQDIAVLSIAAGGAAGGTGFVKLDANPTAYITNATGCPCQVMFWIQRDGGATSLFHYETVRQPAGTYDIATGSITWATAVPSGTTQTFRLKAQVSGGSGAVRAYGGMTAAYFPFGSTGASTLSTSAGAIGASPGRSSP